MSRLAETRNPPAKVESLVKSAFQSHPKLDAFDLFQKLNESNVTCLDLSRYINLLYSKSSRKTDPLESDLAELHTVPSVYQLKPEIMNKLAHAYIFYLDKSISRNSETMPLSPLQLHDLNLLIKLFIKSAQLANAQRILSIIQQKYPQALANNESLGDSTTTCNYLKLCSGGLSRYISLPQKIQSSLPNINAISRRKTVRLGDLNKTASMSQHFKVLSTGQLWSIVQGIMRRSPDELKNISGYDNNLLESIIYSLSSIRRVDVIEKLVDHIWAIKTDSSKMESILSPDSKVIIAVLTSYTVNNSSMRSGFELLDCLYEKYPGLDFGKLFWRRLFQLSSLNNNGFVEDACCTVMEHWHASNRQMIPFDYSICTMIYSLLVKNSSRGGITRVVEMMEKYLISLYRKPAITDKEYQLLVKFQKLALKRALKSKSHMKSLKFITNWNLNEKNRNYLLKYYQHHLRKLKRTEDLKADEIRKMYNDNDEEDTILGKLW